MVATIYCLIDSNTSTPFYVGSTHIGIKNRMSGHLSALKKSPIPLYQYIRDNNISFSIKKLEDVVCEKVSEKYHYELKWIDKITNDGVYLLNKKKPYASIACVSMENRKITIKDGVIFLEVIPDDFDKLIVQMIADGKTYHIIGQHINETEAAVGKLMEMMRIKYICNTTKELVAYFVRNKIIE